MKKEVFDGIMVTLAAVALLALFFGVLMVDATDAGYAVIIVSLLVLLFVAPQVNVEEYY